MSDHRRSHTKLIKDEAIRLGFDQCGISQAAFLEDEAPKLEQWLKNGYHGKMSYMERYFDLRLDPTKLVAGAKSVICLSYNYYPSEEQRNDAYHISKYAYGKDYHDVIRKKLNDFLAYIRAEIGPVEGRGFVDSAPIMERTWAHRSGMGWLGKNSLLLTREKGSFYFLAELIIDLELEYDPPFATDHCGTCTRCIDACPTTAILPDNTIDGSRCISYFTIELKEALPHSMKGKFEDWMFGCDICQDVCPWNRFATSHQEPEFRPPKGLLEMTKEDWEALNESTFKSLFGKSAVKRTKFSGLKRNIDFIKS